MAKRKPDSEPDETLDVKQQRICHTLFVHSSIDVPTYEWVQQFNVVRYKSQRDPTLNARQTGDLIIYK